MTSPEGAALINLLVRLDETLSSIIASITALQTAPWRPAKGMIKMAATGPEVDGWTPMDESQIFDGWKWVAVDSPEGQQVMKDMEILP